MDFKKMIKKAVSDETKAVNFYAKIIEKAPTEYKDKIKEIRQEERVHHREFLIILGDL